MLFQILPLEIENKIWFMAHQMSYAPVLLDVLTCYACLQRRYIIIPHYDFYDCYALEKINCDYLETEITITRIKYKPHSWRNSENVKHTLSNTSKYYHNYLLEFIFDKTHYKKKFIDSLIENGINPPKDATKKQLKRLLMKM